MTLDRLISILTEARKQVGGTIPVTTELHSFGSDATHLIRGGVVDSISVKNSIPSRPEIKILSITREY